MLQPGCFEIFHHLFFSKRAPKVPRLIKVFPIVDFDFERFWCDRRRKIRAEICDWKHFEEIYDHWPLKKLFYVILYGVDIFLEKKFLF